MADKDIKRINLTLPIWMIEEVDTYAAHLGITRTSMVIFMINQYLTNTKIIDTSEKLNKMIDIKGLTDVMNDFASKYGTSAK